MASQFMCVVRRGKLDEKVIVEATDEKHAYRRLAEKGLKLVSIRPATDEEITKHVPRPKKPFHLQRLDEQLRQISEVAVPTGENPNDVWRALPNPPPMPPEVPAQPPAPSHSTTLKIAMEIAPQQPPRPQQSTGRLSIEQIRGQLAALVGMHDVKGDVQQLEDLLKVNAMRQAQGMKPLRASAHYVFRGRPGTGKTTVARILGAIFAAYGVLESGHVIETDRSGLVGEYLGQTAVKTAAVFERALGGVLFIDEAYSLARQNGGVPDPFGLEAIDALLKRMEDNRDKVIVIVAGYPAEMNTFISSNPGMESRFTRYIDFPDYAPDELAEIFERMANDSGFSLTIAARDVLAATSAQLYESRTDRFGNARTMRNLLEASIGCHASRVAGTGAMASVAELSTLLPEDIAFAVGQ